MDAQPTLQEVRSDLASHLYCLAWSLDLQIRDGAGAAMLGLEANTPMHLWPAVADYDLSKVDVAGGLETVYRYAFHGELKRLGSICDDIEDGNLGRIQALIKLIGESDVVSRNWDDVADAHDLAQCRGLAEMVTLASARYHLDSEARISLSDLALLAEMNERSVRNALHAEGESMLAAFRNEEGELVVEKAEALRWLRGRRNFKETVRMGSLERTPEQLAADEIMPFLKDRLFKQYSSDHLREVLKLSDEQIENHPYGCAASGQGLPEDEIRKLFNQPIDTLSPDDCPTIAQILYLDTAWLTTQVMRARFPEAMKELQPEVQKRSTTTVSPFNEDEMTLDVVLTDAGIRNGYFDIERRYADRFFPADSFGSRGAEEKAKEIWLHHDCKGSPYPSDLRVKSETLVSPRKRFSAYFTAHSAKAGDVIRIKQTDERAYELIYLPR